MSAYYEQDNVNQHRCENNHFEQDNVNHDIRDFLSCISDWNLTEHWLEMTMATIRSS